MYNYIYICIHSTYVYIYIYSCVCVCRSYYLDAADRVIYVRLYVSVILRLLKSYMSHSPIRLYVGQGCQGLVTRIEDDGEVLCDIGAEDVARIPARLLGQGAAMRDLTWKTWWGAWDTSMGSLNHRKP